ncbi:recombinase family protein [Neobacillus sp. YIM B02564]|uniref:Recombinase family protein n=1 Tax=Neobacillus paridis TaxID=2803862 RepID=A0ABS1TJG4_9BACI|nr:recombinase family protein [Neobacillus paridis]MBL4951318.1 recombinase family protein [Neobacillus paridis]
MIALYVRVSTEEQAKSGYSLQDQIHQCRDKAGRNADCIEYVDDGYSGEFLERPALSKLRNDLREGLINKVIVYDPDRLSRKLANQLIVTEEIEKRAELIFVNSEYKNTPEGILFYQMRGAFSEFEKAKIKERMTNGRRAKARKNKVVKDVKVYGYKFNKESQELEIYEPEAKIVRLIFELFTDPRGRVQGINGIAHYLTDKGIPTKKRKGVWHRQVVRQILMNETYTGVFYHNKWNTDGMLANKYKKNPEDKIPMTMRPKEEWIPVEVPVIIEKKTFEYAQKLLKESRRRWAGTSKNTYLLSGLVRCGECGNTMTGRRAKNWGTYIFEYSDVKNTAGAKHKGCGNRIKCEDLDEAVWEAFVNLMTTKGQSLSEAAATTEDDTDISFEESELQRIDARLEQIKAGRKRLLNFLTMNADIVDEEDIRNQLIDLKEEEDQLLKLKEETAALLDEMQQEEANDEILSEVVEEYLQAEKTKTLTLERKQELLRKAIREIRVYPSGKVEFIRM